MSELTITLENLPTDRGQPVQVFLNHNPFFTSKDDGSEVSTTLTANVNNNAVLKIQIPTMDFENEREFNLSNGTNVKYKTTETGLSIEQRNTPF